MFQDFLPLGGVSELAQVGAHVTAQNTKSGGLSNTVDADETEDLTSAGRGQPVQLEAVSAVSMGQLVLETLWQIDDFDG